MFFRFPIIFSKKCYPHFPHFPQPEYVDLLLNEMIPEVGRQKLADYIDVFCDKGFFTPEETSRILEAGAKWGMRPKIHADELASSGGV